MMGHEQHIDWHGIRIGEYIPEGVIDRCGNHDGEPGQKLRKIEGKNLTKLPFPAGSQHNGKDHDPEADPFTEEMAAGLIK